MAKRVKMKVNEEIRNQEVESIKTFENGVQEWISHCKRLGKSEQTIKWYTQKTHYIFQFISADTVINLITQETIENFIDCHLDRVDENGKPNPMKATTLNGYIRCLRSLFNWFAEKEYTDQKINLKTIQEGTIVKPTFSKTELRKLLTKPNLKTCRFSEYECWVICNVLYATGTRASTICNLKINNIDFENNVFFFDVMKGNKKSFMPFPPVLTPILQQFLKVRGNLEHNYLFVNSYGGALDIKVLNHMLNRFYKSRGVTTTGIHTWRHTFAKDYIIAGGSSLKLQAILDHETLDMTKHYVKLYGIDKRDDICNPLQTFKESTGYMKINS